MSRQKRNSALRKKRNQQAKESLLAPSGSSSGSKGILLSSLKQRKSDEASIRLRIDASKGSVEPYEEEDPSKALSEALKWGSSIDESTKH